MDNADLLTAVLERTGLRGHVYCRSVGHAPWGLRFRSRPGAVFHAVAAGSCWLMLGKRRVQLVTGDVVLLPHGGAHMLADTPQTKPVDLEAWLARAPEQSGVRRLGSAAGLATDVLCGVYEFTSASAQHPVLARLPDHLHLRTGLSRGDLAGTLASLLGEQARGPLGSGLVIARLLDIMFVQLLRAWLEATPHATGWLSALSDDILGRALTAIHAEPAHPWDVEGLARRSGSSRATLARRFRDRMGEAPLSYVTRVRLDLAAERLTQSAASLAEIAAAVGYRSEFAFSRAFRRQHGAAPGLFRDRAKQLQKARRTP